MRLRLLPVTEQKHHYNSCQRGGAKLPGEKRDRGGGAEENNVGATKLELLPQHAAWQFGPEERLVGGSNAQNVFAGKVPPREYRSSLRHARLVLQPLPRLLRRPLPCGVPHPRLGQLHAAYAAIRILPRRRVMSGGYSRSCG